MNRQVKDGRLGFTVPRSDIRRETFRGSGPGGQNRNKRETGVRLTHVPSGAVGESCDERSQFQNQSVALRRLSESQKFVAWCKMQLALLEEGYRSLDLKVDAMMTEENLRVETYDPDEKDRG